MPAVCFYFQVHQPYRLRNYTVFDITDKHDYFDQQLNREVFLKVANNCYLKANQVWLELLNQYPELKISFSLSGVFLEQALEFCPEVIESFAQLVATNQVEILAETYYHSLSSLYSNQEFVDQVTKHTNLIKKLFGVTPTTFRNTELIYSNQIAEQVIALGYKTMLTEGVDRILAGRSPNHVFSDTSKQLKLLLKDYNLSDDIAFRFSNQAWKEYPLTAEKFVTWLNQYNGGGEIVNLFMDYETFGEHQWEDTGIFDFLRHLPEQVLRNQDNKFVTPNEATHLFPARDIYDVAEAISWADQERDLSAWKSNPMQIDALDKLFVFESEVKATQDLQLIDDWQKLTTSDHFYYMCTKFWSDGDVHKYFSPYESPYLAFIYFVNVLKDLDYKLRKLKN